MSSEEATRTRVRVVHVVVAGNIGGAERMLVDLATRPEESRASHSIALFSPNPEVGALLRASGLRVHDRGLVKEGPVRYLVQTFGRRDVAFVEGVLRAERADVAHLHTFASHVLGTRAARRAHVKILRTDHSARAYQDLSCRPFSSWSLRYADLVVAVSDHLRRLGRERAPWSRVPVRVVWNGVDVERFAHAPLEEVAPRADGAFVFALVGRLEPRKGVEVALDALARTPRARLAIVGDGPERSRLERHARRARVHDRVTFHGFQPDVRPFVRGAHAGLSSSREEGLGLSLLEIMALGRPVVGVPVGGIPEIVKDGVTGRLALGASADALASAMRDLVETPRSELLDLGRSARRFVVEKGSVEAMCRGYADAYAALAPSPASSAGAP